MRKKLRLYALLWNMLTMETFKDGWRSLERLDNLCPRKKYGTSQSSFFKVYTLFTK